ncbi:MAG: cytochrome C [Burkholderiaceae bacterium]|nr:cytochrome C [Burkholderiaceae bacterium]
MTKLVSTLAMLAACSAAGAAGGRGAAPDARSIERGRYILKITGCNDCHTPHYAARAGDVPESQWLTGDRLGYRGPWGTTYAPNLRLVLTQLSEDQWVQKARTLQTRPPMPWFALRQMNENDLRAMHRFAVHLGPAGTPAPPYVPPGRDVKPPYIQWPMAATAAPK